MTGLLLWRVSVFVSKGGNSAKLPRHMPTCLRFRTLVSTFLWTLNITAALVLFDFLLATAVGCWALLTRSEDAMTSADLIQGPKHPKVVVQLPMYNEREVRAKWCRRKVGKWLTWHTWISVRPGVRTSYCRCVCASLALREPRHPGMKLAKRDGQTPPPPSSAHNLLLRVSTFSPSGGCV